MPLILAASLLMALSNASGPSSRPPVICPRSAILHSAAASSVAGILEVDGLDRRENRDLRLLDAKRDGEIDRVLADVGLVLERRRDVDRGIGDDQDLVIGRDVHDEDVADPASRAQPALTRHHRAEELVGVQAAFHQQLGLALTNQLHRLGRGRVAVRRVDDPQLPEVDPARSRDVRGSCPPVRRESV